MGAPYDPPRGAAALSLLAKRLAMTPAAIQHALATLPPRRLASVVPFHTAQAVGDPYEAAAREYLGTPQAPNGLARSMAAQKGLDYILLITRIGHLRNQTRFA